MDYLFDVLREPFETIPVTHFLHNTAHENLHRTDFRVWQIYISLACGKIGQAQMVTQLFFWGSIWNIYLVSKDKERDSSQRLIREQSI